MITDNRSHLEGWDHVFATRDWGRYPPEELIRFMARTYREVPREERKDVNVLEVGCGPGANIWYMVREGFHVHGIEGSPTAVELAYKRLEEEGFPDARSAVDLRQGDFSVLPWNDGYFDVVVDIEAICANTTETIRSVIGEIHRVLKPSGRFFGKMFGASTTGDTSSDFIDERTALNPEVGSCAGFGLTHFFTREELFERFGAFDSISLDWVQRSDHAETVLNFEWLVYAVK